MTRTGNVQDRAPLRQSAAPIVLALGLGIWTIIAAGLDNGHVGIVLDDGIYLSAARALRDGKGYELPGRPGTPKPKYPIGFSGAIALALQVAPGPATLTRDIVVARGVVLASGWLFALAVYAWLRRLGLGPWTTLLIVFSTLFHHVALIGCASTIFSDLPFCALSYVLLARWALRTPSARPSVRSFVDGVLAGIAMLVRGNGITLVLAALVAAASGSQRRRQLLTCALGAALVVVPSRLATRGHERRVPSGDYALEFRAGWTSAASGMEIVGTNIKAMALTFPTDVLLPNMTYTASLVQFATRHPAAVVVLQVAVALCVLFGLIRLVRRSRRRDGPAWVYVAGTLAIFAVWPWTRIIDRFLLSLFPMVLLAFMLGVEGILRWMSQKEAVWRGLPSRDSRRSDHHLSAARPRFLTRRRCQRWGFMALMLVCLGIASVAIRSTVLFHTSGHQWPGGSHRDSLDLALTYLRTQTASEAVVAANEPETVFLYTSRQAVPLLEDDDVVAGRLGRRDRLLLWMAEVPGRPFYLLVRGRPQDPQGVDLGQAAALASDPSFDRREVYHTPDHRYCVDRIVYNK